MSLTDRQQRYVYARAQQHCQRKQPGCTLAATHIELAYPIDQLAALKRDPNNPDNSVAVCNTCSSAA